MQFLYPFIGKTRDFHLSHGDVVVITHKGVVPSFDLLMEALKPWSQVRRDCETHEAHTNQNSVIQGVYVATP